ncbi:MAG: hypothetical protein AABX51_06000 [Nanoarchaeota archaeon]
MDSIEWCLKQKNGLEIMQPNKNMAGSYLKMAEETIIALEGMKSRIWSATASYYVFYYSLYSLMLRIGVKCEIHSCSLRFMNAFLEDFYDPKDNEMIEKAFSARKDLQYYADRPVDDEKIRQIKKYCKDFFIKTKDISARITDAQIREIRLNLQN